MMTKEIKIIDDKGKPVLRFSEFNFQYDSVLRRIVLTVSINFEIFTASQRMEFEEADFLYLRDGLEKICSSRYKEVAFKPMIDQRISIDFKSKNTEIIEVHGCIYNKLFTGELKFKFETTTQHLLTFVKEVDEVLEENLQV